MPALHLVLGFVVLQRVGELAFAHRNHRALRARGAVEVGRGHYPAIVALHTAWLLALATTIDPATAVSLPWAGIFVLLECGRAWVIASLGRRWTTRVLVLPGTAPIRSGPYRYLKHPNYVIVCGEMAVAQAGVVVEPGVAPAPRDGRQASRRPGAPSRGRGATDWLRRNSRLLGESRRDRRPGVPSGPDLPCGRDPCRAGGRTGRHDRNG